ncbi:MAG: hypothetical protein K0M48_05915 [Thiobacillus sp.]|nr:hypothetical protein [Thiobacillus sp.]
MTTNFSREAAADRLDNLTFGDTRLLCRAGTAGREGNEEQVFENYEDFERYCAADGNDPDMVDVEQLRNYLCSMVMRSTPDVSERVLSRFLEPREVAAVIAAGRRPDGS